MGNTTDALALTGALLLAGDDVRLGRQVAVDVFERSPAAAWSRVIEATNTAHLTPVIASAHTDSGRFSVLTYNVAGLPDVISASHPSRNVALISPLLNKYDLALVQEDFYYHADLCSRSRHAFRSEPMLSSLAFAADGLSILSRFALGWTHRVRWTRCSGFLRGESDCLADKGFSFAEIALADGVVVDVYNLHADAGAEAADARARRANFEQLTSYIASRSQNRAVIAAGDTNLRASRPEDAKTLERFLQMNELEDACRHTQCGDTSIDRVMFRSSPAARLSVSGWRKDPTFVDQRGSALSDHPAIRVEFTWERATSRVAGY